MHAVMSGIQLICVLLFLGSLYAPSAAEHDRERRSTEDEIKAMTDTFISGFVKHDSEAVMNMWHPDGYLSEEGIPLAHGKEAIRNMTKQDSSLLQRMDRKYLEVGPNEEGADYVYVLFNEKWYNQEDKLFADKKCLLVWRNTDDGYKVSFLMVNSNV